MIKSPAEEAKRLLEKINSMAIGNTDSKDEFTKRRTKQMTLEEVDKEIERNRIEMSKRRNVE